MEARRSRSGCARRASRCRRRSAGAFRVGLPLAAILAATVPVWGMSWYFDTENWAAGIWNSWAESRTDTWREAMVRAVLAAERRPRPRPSRLRRAARRASSGDFSFIVIGDTGEGDASQHVLRDQLLAVANQRDVRFVVISSDVVYPTGAMQRLRGEVLAAVQGRHASRSTPFPATTTGTTRSRRSPRRSSRPTPRARASARRVEADLRLTSTTDGRIEASDRARRIGCVGTTACRRASSARPSSSSRPIGSRWSPSTPACCRTIDADAGGVARRGARRARRASSTMAILGHPFYAGGHDTTLDDEPSSRVSSSCCCDTASRSSWPATRTISSTTPSRGATPATTVHYFVNGGGGAYLSFGTALAWPAQPPTPDWAYYPDPRRGDREDRGRDAVVEAAGLVVDAQFGAWPFSAEWLSAVFDYNVAPFFQSFVEVRVEPSANRVRLIPYGVHGRLTWGTSRLREPPCRLQSLRSNGSCRCRLFPRVARRLPAIQPCGMALTKKHDRFVGARHTAWYREIVGLANGGSCESID